MSVQVEAANRIQAVRRVLGEVYESLDELERGCLAPEADVKWYVEMLTQTSRTRQKMLECLQRVAEIDARLLRDD